MEYADTIETDAIPDQNEDTTPENNATHSRFAQCQGDVPKESSKIDVIHQCTFKITVNLKTYVY